MPRIARIIAADYPHHVTQRGNRRMQTFFSDEDYEAYLQLMAKWLTKRDVAVWAYCLMPNHVHLIVVPKTEDGLRRGIGEAHRRYTRMINFREKWRGHLWQGRYPMDERHLLAAAKYIERNPVAAGMCGNQWDYPWSSARAHIAGRDDILVRVKPLLSLVEEWRDWISQDTNKEMMKKKGSTNEPVARHSRAGPLGDDAFIDELEVKTDRELKRKKTGPKGPRQKVVEKN